MYNEYWLKVEDLTVVGKNDTTILNSISFKIPKGYSTALIGESGSGKTTLLLSIIGLLPKWKGEISSGSVILSGFNILNLSFYERVKLMWKEYSYVAQNPFQMFDPARPIGPQIEELKTNFPRSRDSVYKFFKDFELTPEERVFNSYSIELSGGMLQRCSLIYGLFQETPILILDEPLSQIHQSLRKKIIRNYLIPFKNRGGQLFVVTHDITLLDSLVDYAIILFRGKITEFGNWSEIKLSPQHPYTELLLEILDGNYSLDLIRKKWEKIKRI